MTKLPQIKDGQWVRPVHRGFVAQCCQCGLKHRMDFRIVGKAVEFRARRVRK